jgi:NADPH-dependent glutamate synthase beta subunit-like oxidoreductase
LLPPCNAACPAGENIQAWLALATAGEFRKAWEVLVADNPLPATVGRVCYHPCQGDCNRVAIDHAVNIHAVERFLGDLALTENWDLPMDAPPSGKKILIVGAGPSGLSCAYHLRRLGHDVEIREAGPVAGGMMHFGIPAYRLPRKVLEGEVRRLQRMGVRIVTDHKVEDVLAEKEEGGFEAAFLAVGAHIGKKTEMPAREAGKILDAVSFLKSVEMGAAPRLGRRVAIYGGGNTAMDAARVAARLGSDPIIIYRRDRAHMPAHASEAEEALEEGVKIHWLRTIRSLEDTEITVEVMEIDDQGRPFPTGETESLTADHLILAIGQDADTNFLRGVQGIQFRDDGSIVVDAGMMTGHPGLFAGGDMVPAERTATVAIGHGKKAARNIDAFLQGIPYEKERPVGVATLDKMHLWFYSETTPRTQEVLHMGERMGGFQEIRQGLTEGEARYEAKRCLSCGNCFECDGCYGACPEDAVIKLGLGKRYLFNYDRCTGCTTCFEQCPCHAIEMIPEPEVSL